LQNPDANVRTVQGTTWPAQTISRRFIKSHISRDDGPFLSVAMQVAAHEAKLGHGKLAELEGHDPRSYLRDVLERLPLHPNRGIEELLPHRWKAPASR
jgi:IS66 C-terminal element